MWAKDIQAKQDREDREAQKVADRNKQVSTVLKEQMQVLEYQKEEEKRIRADTARLMVKIISYKYFFRLLLKDF